MKDKTEVKQGDIIHIHHIFGVENAREFCDEEGVVTYVDINNNIIYGTWWGGIALRFDDDWEIIG